MGVGYTVAGPRPAGDGPWWSNLTGGYRVAILVLLGGRGPAGLGDPPDRRRVQIDQA